MAGEFGSNGDIGSTDIATASELEKNNFSQTNIFITNKGVLTGDNARPILISESTHVFIKNLALKLLRLCN